MAAIPSLPRRPQRVQEAPQRPPKPSRSGTYAATRPREPAEEVTTEELTRAFRCDEDREVYFALAPDETLRAERETNIGR